MSVKCCIRPQKMCFKSLVPKASDMIKLSNPVWSHQKHLCQGRLDKNSTWIHFDTKAKTISVGLQKRTIGLEKRWKKFLTHLLAIGNTNTFGFYVWKMVWILFLSWTHFFWAPSQLSKLTSLDENWQKHYLHFGTLSDPRK